MRSAGYKGPGGADEVAIAPAGFGTLGGEVLLTVDAGPAGGHLLAMAPTGRTHSLMSFPGDGPNPIVAIPKSVSTTGTPAPGIYITDDITQDIYYVSAAQLVTVCGRPVRRDRTGRGLLDSGAPGGHRPGDRGREHAEKEGARNRTGDRGRLSA